MLYLIFGGKHEPHENKFDKNYYLMSFSENAESNTGYFKKTDDNQYKLYFWWSGLTKYTGINSGKNYKYFTKLEQVIDYLLKIGMSDVISLVIWNGKYCIPYKKYSIANFGSKKDKEIKAEDIIKETDFISHNLYSYSAIIEEVIDEEEQEVGKIDITELDDVESEVMEESYISTDDYRTTASDIWQENQENYGGQPDQFGDVW